MRAVTIAWRVPTFCTAPVLDVETSPYGRYVVREYIRGESLERLVAREGRLSRDSLKRLAVGTATLLTGIHGVGVVLHELTPDRVLLGPDGPRIIDFSAATLLDPVTARSSGVTPEHPGMSTGRISSMEGDLASDVLSWGAVMVFAMTGVPGSRSGAGEHDALDADPGLSSLPEPMRTVVASALDKRREQRPTSVELLHSAALTGVGPASRCCA